MRLSELIQYGLRFVFKDIQCLPVLGALAKSFNDEIFANSGHGFAEPSSPLGS